MDTLYWFMFLARPQPANPNYSRVPAAFINAWVGSSEEPTAEHIARDAVEGEHWTIERLQEWSIVSRQNFKNLPGVQKCFDEALLKGHCLAFYHWPSD